MEYIDSEKLLAEIKKIQHSLENRDIRLNQVKKIRTESMIEFCECITNVIESLQQEQSEVDLEKDIQNVIHNHFFDLNGIAIAGTSSYATVDDMVYIAKHFFELGLKAKQG